MFVLFSARGKEIANRFNNQQTNNSQYCLSFRN